jgi:hypothetical protein
MVLLGVKCDKWQIPDLSEKNDKSGVYVESIQGKIKITIRQMAYIKEE